VSVGGPCSTRLLTLHFRMSSREPGGASGAGSGVGSGAAAALDVGAIPLVTVPDDGESSVGAKFTVNPEAIAYLQSIQTKVMWGSSSNGAGLQASERSGLRPRCHRARDACQWR
jgi:hypothetical protein